MTDYSSMWLAADNYFVIETGRCRYCSSGCDDCQGTGRGDPHEADLVNLLHNLAVAGALATVAAENAEAKADVLRQAARIAALESELATLQASVVAALSAAGPEVGEDERTA
jgi:hypothetical protein